MKISISSVSVYLFLVLILIIEGFGLPSGRSIARYLICGFPALLFGIDIWNKKPIRVPIHVSLLFILFSFATAISTITAVNVQTAFEHQLYYAGVFLLFIYVYNHQAEIKCYFPYFVIISTIIVFGYAVFINMVLPDEWSFLIPLSGYQFVYLGNNATSHYSFGSFMLIPLIFSFTSFWNKPSRLNFLLVLSLFILLLLSFLRSAYLAFIAVVIMTLVGAYKMRRGNLLPYIIITFIVVVSSLLFLLAITNFSFQIPVISNANDFLMSHFDALKYKSLVNGRLEFVRQALVAIANRPLTGFGSYNFYYAAMRFADSYAITTGTSHNLFLDIFVENGLIGGTVFIILVALLIKKGFKAFVEGSVYDKSIYGIFIALFVLFQFGHYHKFYFLFVLFFFVAALLYSEKNTVKDTVKITAIASAILFLLNIVIVTSFILFNNKKYSISYMMYPISVQANQALILEHYDKRLYQKTEIQLKQFYALYPKEPLVLDFIGSFYQNISAHGEAIKYYKYALQYSPQDVSYLVQIYEQLEKLQGEETAKKYVQKYVVKHDTYKNNPPDDNMTWFYEWCTRKKIQCKK